MSFTKTIAAAASASCIFVFLMTPATAGVKAGDDQTTANDAPGRVVVDSKTSVVASLTLGVVGSAVEPSESEKTFRIRIPRKYRSCKK